MTTSNDLTRQLEAIINRDARLANLFGLGREPRWRYFGIGRSLDQDPKRGFPAFAWSTERNPDGKFESWVYMPKGDHWLRRKVVLHSKRSAAKARALKLRDAYKAR